MELPEKCKRCVEKVRFEPAVVVPACVAYHDEPHHWQRMLNIDVCPRLWRELSDILIDSRKVEEYLEKLRGVKVGVSIEELKKRGLVEEEWKPLGDL